MKTNRTPFLLFLLAMMSCAGVWSAESPSVAERAGGKSATKVHKVGVEEFDKLRSVKTNTVLDVRTAEEFKAGHIPGATNIDVNSPDFEKKIGELDKSKTYLVHCAAGVRSARACQKLEKMGFPELYDLSPGFRGWQKAGKPVEK